MRFRLGGAAKRQGPAAELLRNQWPLIGVLCLPLFIDLYDVLNRGPRVAPTLACSAVAAMAAVYAARKPVVSGLVHVGVVLATGPAFLLAPRSYHPLFEALPVTEIAAGTVIVIFLVRQAKSAHAWLVIAAMSTAVALVVTANALRRGTTGDLQAKAITAVLLLGMSIAVGLYFRARDSERAKVVEAAVNDAQTSERMALARELHDVVAHHVTGIVVQAQAARMTGEANPAMALESLGRIEKAGTDALVAMRRLVKSMRTTDESEQATTDLAADLRQLAGSANQSVPIDFSIDVPPDIPQEVARSALRLVQESLTNVGKHASDATCVRVLVEVVHGDLHIRVANDGFGAAARPAGGSGGYGLVGMRERVELLHGRLTAGPAEGGWVVEAWLPLEGEAE
jgi:signal transduction histidine kinase